MARSRKPSARLVNAADAAAALGEDLSVPGLQTITAPLASLMSSGLKRPPGAGAASARKDGGTKKQRMVQASPGAAAAAPLAAPPTGFGLLLPTMLSPPSTASAGAASGE
jgi:hypothetical protein